MPETLYDLLVLGAGTGGYRAAIHAARQGMSVAVVDERPLPGGVCLHEGCIPSKALLQSSALFAHSVQGLEQHGIDLQPPQLDLARMMTRKQQIVDRLSNGVKFLFQTNHIDYVRGRGRLLPPGPEGHQLEVVTEQGTQVMSARRILLASGSCPHSLAQLPVDGHRILHARHALSLDQVPEHLLIVGAGAIGLEIGSLWRRLGAEVTVVEMLERIAAFAEPPLAAALQKELEAQGISFRLQCRVEGVADRGALFAVSLTDAQGNAEQIDCDRILVAVGRRPNSGVPGLEHIGLAPEADGSLAVDEDFRTAANGVYALGDLIGGPMLAHKAALEAQVFVQRLSGQAASVDYTLVPKVIYTSPELAVVGRSATELKQQGVAYVTRRLPFMINGRSHCQGDTTGYVEMLAATDSGRLLGVAILGASAAELINQATAVMTIGGSVSDLARCCQAHPTQGELLTETAQELLLKFDR